MPCDAGAIASTRSRLTCFDGKDSEAGFAANLRTALIPSVSFNNIQRAGCTDSNSLGCADEGSRLEDGPLVEYTVAGHA